MVARGRGGQAASSRSASRLSAPPSPLVLVPADPLPDRVIRDSVLAADGEEAHRRHVRRELLIRRAFDLPTLRSRLRAGPVDGPDRTSASNNGGSVSCGTNALPAPAAASRLSIAPVLRPQCVSERRRTVRAHDPQVLDPVVGRNAVDVVQHQRHRRRPFHSSSWPHSSQRGSFSRLVVQTPLEIVAVVRRVLDEHRLEWDLLAVRPAVRRAHIRVEMLGPEPVTGLSFSEACVVAALPAPAPAKRSASAHACRTRDALSNLRFACNEASSHTRTLVRALGRKQTCLQVNRIDRTQAGEPGLGPEQTAPKAVCCHYTTPQSAWAVGVNHVISSPRHPARVRPSTG